MKHLVIAAVLTLLMLSPAKAVDVHDLSGALLVASRNSDQKEKPSVLIIKGQGGKVTDVQPVKPEDDKKSKKKKKK